MSTEDSSQLTNNLQRGSDRLTYIIDTLILTYQRALKYDNEIDKKIGILVKIFRETWDKDLCDINIDLMKKYSVELHKYKMHIPHGSQEFLNTINRKILADRVINILSRIHSIDFSIKTLKTFIEDVQHKKIEDALNAIIIPSHTPSNIKIPSGIKKVIN